MLVWHSNELVSLHGLAIGLQMSSCEARASAFSWKLTCPSAMDASLFWHMLHLPEAHDSFLHAA